MQQTTEALLKELDELKTEFAPICARLADSDEELHDSAPGIPESLAPDLNRFNQRLAELGAKVTGFGKELSLSQLPVGDLDALGRSLETIAVAERWRRQTEIHEKALTALERVLGIVRRDHALFPPLLACQSKARELRSEILTYHGEGLHPQAQELSDGVHVFSLLLDLVEPQDDLADDEYVRFQRLVRESLGEELAIAAARGKLELEPLHASADQPSPEPVNEAASGKPEVAQNGSGSSKPHSTGVENGVLEAIQLADRCRLQGLHSEADTVYQKLLEVKKGPPARRESFYESTPTPAAIGTQPASATDGRSSRKSPSRPATGLIEALPQGKEDIDREINAVLENISRLAVKAQEASGPVAMNPGAVSSANPSEATVAAVEEYPHIEKASASEEFLPAELIEDFVPVPASRSVSPTLSHSVAKQREARTERPLEPTKAGAAKSEVPAFMQPQPQKTGFGRYIALGVAGIAVALGIYAAVGRPPASAPAAAMLSATVETTNSPGTDLSSVSPPQSPMPPTATAAPAATTGLAVPAATPENARPVQSSEPNQLTIKDAQRTSSPVQPEPPKPVPIQLSRATVAQSTPQAAAPPPAPAAKKEFVAPEPPNAFVGSVGDIGKTAPGSAFANLASAAVPAPPPVVPTQQLPVRDNGQLNLVLISSPRPEYPKLAQQNHIQGTVRLEILIGKDGSVSKVSFLAGHPLLRDAAVAAVRQWRYRPAIFNGSPTEVVTIVNVNFALGQQ